MTKQASSSGYCAYLLRCWQESSHVADSQSWRFSLEDPHTGARHGFASFDALMAFLHKQLRDDACSIASAPAYEQARECAPPVAAV